MTHSAKDSSFSYPKVVHYLSIHTIKKKEANLSLRLGPDVVESWYSPSLQKYYCLVSAGYIYIRKCHSSINHSND